VVSGESQWTLDTRRLGKRVLVYDVLDSTNSVAASLAGDSSNDGLAILADCQTSGRGQHGRAWVSVPGAGVLLSLLLFPPSGLRRPALLNAWAAVSVCETIAEVAGLRAQIKWPNDVLINGRKACGILIEQAEATVVGIGLNVNQTAAELTDAQLLEAGSLHIAGKRSFNRDQVARSLIQRLDAEYHALCCGDIVGLEKRWRELLGLVGQSVHVKCHDAAYQGVLVELGFEGLVLQSASATCDLAPEAVRQITAC